VTLVCSMTKPYPLLFGDLALTGLWRSQGYTGRVPTVGRGLGPHGKVRSRYLTGFTQKVLVLGPKLAIGWAGSPVAARMVLDAARDNYGTTGVDITEMGRLLTHLDFRSGKIGGLHLSLIGMSLPDDRDASFFTFGHRTVLHAHRDFGDVFALGSGEQHALHNIQSIGETVREWH
jgi:hypothetical protein